MADVNELAEELVNLTIKEANELADILEEEYGIEPAGGAVAVAGAPGGDGEEGDGEEKSEFDVVLQSFGDKKIQVIKEVRNITGMGLKEAKDLVDNAPNTIKEAVPKEDAEEMRQSLEEAGGEVELQ